MKVIKNGRIILEDRIIDGNVYIDNGKIFDITEDLPYDFDEVIDAEGNYVSPGFIDIHTHGGLGLDYTTATPEEIAKVVDFNLSNGTTTILPTISAAKHEVTKKALENIKKCMDCKMSKGNIYGVHLEGPYFSLEMTGAQNPEYITEPKKADYTEIVEKFGDIVKRWSYAPERDTNGEFCKFIKENGIVPTAGHTAAKYDDMLLAMENGLRSVTHLYSCTSTITREQGFRKLGVIETAFLHDDIYAEIIADGKHLPPELIKLIYKIKGEDKIILVTDSIPAAGSDKKEHVISGIECIVEDGVCKLKDRSAFAGSIATSNRLIRVCTKEAGIPLYTAVKMLTKNPAEHMGIKNKGQLKKGYDADIIIFDEDINILKVCM